MPKPKLQRCFHCDSPMQVYRWAYAKRFMKGLLALYEVGGAKKTSELKMLKQNDWGQFYFNKYWGLATKDTEDRWRLTTTGELFLRGLTQIPKYVWIYKGRQTTKPDGDETDQEIITARDVDWEIVTKATAIAESTPHDEHTPWGGSVERVDK